MFMIYNTAHIYNLRCPYLYFSCTSLNYSPPPSQKEKTSSCQTEIFSETQQSSHEGMEPLVTTHSPSGSWDESAAESRIITQSTRHQTFKYVNDLVCSLSAGTASGCGFWGEKHKWKLHRLLGNPRPHSGEFTESTEKDAFKVVHMFFQWVSVNVSIQVLADFSEHVHTLFLFPLAASGITDSKMPGLVNKPFNWIN